MSIFGFPTLLNDLLDKAVTDHDLKKLKTLLHEDGMSLQVCVLSNGGRAPAAQAIAADTNYLFVDAERVVRYVLTVQR